MALDEIFVDESTATDEDIQEALALLNKKREHKAKVERGEIKGEVKWSDMTPEQKAQANKANRKRSIYVKLMLQKAEEFDITVSEEEIEKVYAEKYPNG
jgi:hypothetical protein